MDLRKELDLAVREYRYAGGEEPLGQTSKAPKAPVGVKSAMSFLSMGR